MRAASYALLLRKKLFFAVRDGSRIFAICLCTPAGILFSSYAWPAPTTYHRPLCEHCGDPTVRWVGAPHERTLFRIHDEVVGFVDRRRGLGIPPLRTKHPPGFFSSRYSSNIGPINVFRRGFPKVWNFRFEESCS